MDVIQNVTSSTEGGSESRSTSAGRNELQIWMSSA